MGKKRTRILQVQQLSVSKCSFDKLSDHLWKCSCPRAAHSALNYSGLRISLQFKGRCLRERQERRTLCSVVFVVCCWLEMTSVQASSKMCQVKWSIPGRNSRCLSGLKMYLRYIVTDISLSLAYSAMQSTLSIFSLTKVIQKQKAKILKFEFSSGIYFLRSDNGV